MVADRVFQAVLPYEPYFKLDGSLLAEAVNGELLTNNAVAGDGVCRARRRRRRRRWRRWGRR